MKYNKITHGGGWLPALGWTGLLLSIADQPLVTKKIVDGNPVETKTIFTSHDTSNTLLSVISLSEIIKQTLETFEAGFDHEVLFGEVAYLASRSAIALNTMPYLSPWMMKYLRSICGEYEVLAWLYLAGSVTDKPQMWIEEDIPFDIAGLREAGYSFDKFLPYAVRGIYSLEGIQMVLENDIDYSLLSAVAGGTP